MPNHGCGIYVSGPMRGYADFNFPLFDEATAWLRSLGHYVYNPAEHDRDVYPNITSWQGFASGDTAQCPAFNLPDSLSWDFKSILDAQAIAMLPGWMRSTGARAERFVAEAVGKTVYLVSFYSKRERDEKFQLSFDHRKMMEYPQLLEEYRVAA